MIFSCRVCCCHSQWFPYRFDAAAGDAAAADARSGRKTVDLDGLSFAQGGHLNTNKNTNLPPGSTRTTDKVHCGVWEFWSSIEVASEN